MKEICKKNQQQKRREEVQKNNNEYKQNAGAKKITKNKNINQRNHNVAAHKGTYIKIHIKKQNNSKPSKSGKHKGPLHIY